MPKNTKSRHHWTVRLNHVNRSASFVMMFAIVGAHMMSRSYDTMAWFLLVMQFLVYPHVVFWLARQSSDSRHAELNNLTSDSFLFGVWIGALGFPLWIAFTMFASTTINQVLYRGARGAGISTLALLTGVLLAVATGGWHFSPAMDLSATVICMVGLILYLLIIADFAYKRNQVLYETRQQLLVSEQSLRQQNAAKTRFLAYAGHDLRQPLQALRLFLASLFMTKLDPDQLHLVRRIDTSASSLSDLLDTLLDISKLDAGVIVPEPLAVDADILLAQLIHEFEPQAQAKGLRLKLQMPEKGATVVTDEKLLLSVLRNLLANAIKYTDKGGVLVAMRQKEHTVKIQVLDTGPGISDEEQQHIFEEFYQIDNPNRDRAKGLGLGLAIVQRISALLDLKISCRSRVGHGTMMEIVLPLSSVDRAPPSAPSQPAQHPLDLSGLHVVLIEDSAEVAAALLTWLESQHARVSHFASAEETLAEAESIKAADFFLCDYRLPGNLTGIDFLNAMQTRYGKIRHAALLTGDTSSDFIEAATASGWQILFKPIQPARLHQVLSQLRQRTKDVVSA